MSSLVIADLQERAETAEAVARLLEPSEDGSRRPTAIVATNDHLAWQVIQELQERGISVKSDPKGDSIAVTGFDDLPFAGLCAAFADYGTPADRGDFGYPS